MTEQSQLPAAINQNVAELFHDIHNRSHLRTLPVLLLVALSVFEGAYLVAILLVVLWFAETMYSYCKRMRELVLTMEAQVNFLPPRKNDYDMLTAFWRENCRAWVTGNPNSYSLARFIPAYFGLKTTLTPRIIVTMDYKITVRRHSISFG